MKRKDLTGQRFGKLIALSYVGNQNGSADVTAVTKQSSLPQISQEVIPSHVDAQEGQESSGV